LASGSFCTAAERRCDGPARLTGRLQRPTRSDRPAGKARTCSLSCARPAQPKADHLRLTQPRHPTIASALSSKACAPTSTPRCSSSPARPAHAESAPRLAVQPEEWAAPGPSKHPTRRPSKPTVGGLGAGHRRPPRDPLHRPRALRLGCRGPRCSCFKGYRQLGRPNCAAYSGRRTVAPTRACSGTKGDGQAARGPCDPTEPHPCRC